MSITQGNTTYTKKDNLTQYTIIKNAVYEWCLSPYMRIVGTISNISGSPYTETINSWANSGLQRMYTGLQGRRMSIASESAEVQLDLELTFQIQKIDGSWETIAPNQHGMVFAESESMDGFEYAYCYVENTSNWYIIDKPTAPYSNESFQTAGYYIETTNDTINTTPINELNCLIMKIPSLVRP